MNYNNILVCIAGEQFSLQQVIDANMDDCPLAQEQIDMIANASIGETVSIDFGAEEITIVSK